MWQDLWWYTQSSTVAVATSNGGCATGNDCQVQPTYIYQATGNIFLANNPPIFTYLPTNSNIATGSSSSYKETFVYLSTSNAVLGSSSSYKETFVYLPTSNCVVGSSSSYKETFVYLPTSNAVLGSSSSYKEIQYCLGSNGLLLAGSITVQPTYIYSSSGNCVTGNSSIVRNGSSSISLVAKIAAASSNGGNVTTSGINTTEANLLVAFIASLQTNSASISDSKGNSWTGLTKKSSSGSGSNESGQIFYCYNPTVGTGHTFTASAASGNSYPSVEVMAFSGAGNSPFDVQNTNATTVGQAVTSIQTGSVTPSINNELIIAGLAFNDNTTVSVNSLMTITNQFPNLASINFGSAFAYIVQTSATTTNPTFSWTTGSPVGLQAIGCIAVFKDSGLNITASGNVASSGSATYTEIQYYTGSSGCVLGNTSAAKITYTYLSTAGVASSNSAVYAETFVYLPTAGATLSNSAISSEIIYQNASGAGVFNGASNLVFNIAYVANGNIQFGGFADYTAGTSYSISASGGITTGSTASIRPSYIYSATSGLNIGATANFNELIFILASGVIASSSTANAGIVFNNIAGGNFVASNSSQNYLLLTRLASGSVNLGSSALTGFNQFVQASGSVNLSSTASSKLILNSITNANIVVCSGFIYQPIFVVAATGGSVISGTSSGNLTETYQASNGMCLGATATVMPKYNYTANNNLIFGGTATASSGTFYNYTASGGIACTQTINVVPSYQINTSGNLNASATSNFSTTLYYLASGSVNLSGSTTVNCLLYNIANGNICLSGITSALFTINRISSGCVNLSNSAVTNQKYYFFGNGGINLSGAIQFNLTYLLFIGGGAKLFVDNSVNLFKPYTSLGAMTLHDAANCNLLQNYNGNGGSLTSIGNNFYLTLKLNGSGVANISGIFGVVGGQKNFSYNVISASIQTDNESEPVCIPKYITYGKLINQSEGELINFHEEMAKALSEYITYAIYDINKIKSLPILPENDPTIIELPKNNVNNNRINSIRSAALNKIKKSQEAIASIINNVN